MSELEILDYVLLKGRVGNEISEKEKAIKHFILLPFYKTEKNMFEFEQQYFTNLNVTAIPYAIDERGYEQLYYVIERWEKEINLTSSFLYKNYQLIEQNSNDYIKKNATEIFQLIRNDEHFGNHFFKKLSTVKWFDPLKEKDYFSPEKAPGFVEAEEKGTYKIPVWNVLQYLERVSEQVNVVENEGFIDELLGIIKNVTNYHIEHNKKLDNYRTWWFFVKILLNIPNDKISDDIIKLLPTWLDSKFDTTLQGSDIARKLLPKFLNSNNSDDWKKAEKIIEYITNIKWVPLPKERTELVGEKEKPKTILNTHWLLDTFKKKAVAVKVGENCSEKIIFILANRIKEIFRKEFKEHGIDVKYKKNICRINIRHLKEYEYKGSFGVIKKEELEKEKTEDNLFKGIKAKPEKEFFFELKNCKNRRTFVEKIKREVLSNKLFKDLNKVVGKELSVLYDNIFIDFSYMWFESLGGVYNAKGILTVMLKDIILAKARKEKRTTRKIFKKFLGEEYQYPLFTRLVLFVIGKEWNGYKDVFWKMLKKEKDRLFNGSHFKDEIFKLLKNNVKVFSQEEKEIVKEIIEKGPQKNLPKDNRNKSIAYWKQGWYLALKSDPCFAKLYKKMKEMTGTEVKEKTHQIQTRWGPGKSPLTKEQIVKMPNEELAKFMIGFKGGDLFNPPTVEGLATTFKSTVQEEPGKFIENLSPFLNVGYYYVYYLLWGIKDAWIDKKNIDWDKLLKFTKEYIDKPGFWEGKFKIKGEDARDAEYSWITGMVGELIQEGTRSDAWAFSEKYFTVTKEILFTLLDKEKNQKEQERGAVIQALNSPFGKNITALIYLTLRIVRVETKKGNKKEPKWLPDIKKKYEKVLKDEIVEAYTLVGQYSANLHYLDKKWVENKIENFLTLYRKKVSLWEAFLEGYLFNGELNKYVYFLMKEHYELAIDHFFKDENMKERLVQHISIGYLGGHENFKENSLFGKLLKKCPEHIKEIISFFWSQREYVNGSEDKEGKEVRNKILKFWRWVYEKYKKTNTKDLNKEDREILSELVGLTVFLLQINAESNEWLLLSAPFIDFHASLFIFEDLDRLKDKGESVKYIGKILLAILEKYTPDYREEDIYSIVKFLYQSKDKKRKEEANEICTICDSRGIDFLKKLWEENNPDQIE